MLLKSPGSFAPDAQVTKYNRQVENHTVSPPNSRPVDVQPVPSHQTGKYNSSFGGKEPLKKKKNPTKTFLPLFSED